MAVLQALKWHRPFAHIKNKQWFLLSNEEVKRKLKAEVTYGAGRERAMPLPIEFLVLILTLQKK